jgi:hypothetical protein
MQPFVKEHAKAFREQLIPDDRDRLAVLLKRYAPGKVRYTLPALYLEEDFDLKDMRPRPRPSNLALQHDTAGDGDHTQPLCLPPRVLDVSKMKPIALPSLNIQIPGLDDWLEYEIRYRHIDRQTLRTAGSSYQKSFRSPRLLKELPVAVARPRPRRRGSRRNR